MDKKRKKEMKSKCDGAEEENDKNKSKSIQENNLHQYAEHHKYTYNVSKSIINIIAPAPHSGSAQSLDAHET